MAKQGEGWLSREMDGSVKRCKAMPRDGWLSMEMDG